LIELMDSLLVIDISLHGNGNWFTLGGLELSDKLLGAYLE